MHKTSIRLKIRLSVNHLCKRIVETKCNSSLDYWIHYQIHAENFNNGEFLPIFLDFMTTGRLWITDIYPEMWVNDDCKST